MTCRNWGVSNDYKVYKLNQLIQGWINYFKIGSMKGLCERLDGNIRYRLRMCIWKHRKTPKNRAESSRMTFSAGSYQGLRKCGSCRWISVRSCSTDWWIMQRPIPMAGWCSTSATLWNAARKFKSGGQVPGSTEYPARCFYVWK